MQQTIILHCFIVCYFNWITACLVFHLFNPWSKSDPKYYIHTYIHTYIYLVGLKVFVTICLQCLILNGKFIVVQYIYDSRGQTNTGKIRSHFRYRMRCLVWKNERMSRTAITLHTFKCDEHPRHHHNSAFFTLLVMKTGFFVCCKL